MGLVSELKRRNVLRMAVLYVLAAWVIMQVAEVVIALASLPAWAGSLVLTVLAIGFPIALVLSWFYEITPEGLALEKDVASKDSITRITGRRMDFIVIALLAAAVAMFAYDKWFTDRPAISSLAVLPLENLSGDESQVYFTDGMTEAINDAEEEFGEERLEALLNQYADLGAREICDKLIDDLLKFQEGMPQFDDMTVFVLKVKNS